jgi:uroporphyrinogen III methyltransferase/synthase
MTQVGKVYLVGAGPGDPGLITVKGVECIRQADVVLYDYLVNETLLQLAPAECKRISVGKRKRAHTIPQGEINDLLVKLAREGKTVVRLKGGDPFVFGRGGEEALTLAENDVPFEIVPGVTAGAAAAAYAGIPLTRRGLSSSVVLVTGHEDPTKETTSVDWHKIAAADTIVIYMGRSNLPAIVDSLLGGGMSPDKPAAAIQWGTTASQRTVTGNLGNIVERCSKEKIEAPAIVVVGDVVTLRDKLNWFEGKPLFGKRIMITRDRSQAKRTSAELERYGAEVIEFPTIRIMPLADYAELDAEIAKLGSYDWAVFTSANGVRHFFARLDQLGLDTRAFADVKVCAVGPATAEEAKLHGLLVDCIPQQYTTESIADELARVDPEISKKKVLLPRADIATDALTRRLDEIGADATEVDVYRVVPEEDVPQRAADALSDGQVDIVLFTSSSTARNFARLTADAGITVHPNVKFASIGPVTTRTAEEIGYKICCEAEQHTIPCLIQTIISSLPRS